MQIKKYCLIAFIGEKLSEAIKEEIISISNETPNYTYIKNNFFITFSSAFEIGEIENLLSERQGLVFFLFKNEGDNLGFNLPNRIEKHLFGKLNCKVDLKVVLSAPVEYIDVSFKIDNPPDLTQEEKLNIIDEILDRGLENINEEEKNKLNSLFKNNKVENINQ